jgi:hypothetical protein
MNKITLLDKEFYFGIGFLNELLDGTGMKLEDLAAQPDAVLMPKLMYYSLMYSRNRNQQEFNMSMYDINDLIDENGGIGGKFWNEFKLAFNNSMYKDVPAQEAKKKVIPKKKV